MADDIKNENGDPSQESFTQDQLEKIVQSRLAREQKKHEAELAMRVAEAQAQGQAQPPANGSPPESAPMQPQQPVAPNVAPQGQPSQPPQMEGQSTGGTPLTTENFGQAMQAKDAQLYAHHQLQEMMSEDPEFSKLAQAQNENPLPVAPEAAVAIINRLGRKAAKSLLTTVFKDPMENAILENHVLKGNFEQWLAKRMQSAPSASPAPNSEPDLSGDAMSETERPTFNNSIDSYMSGKA